MQTTRKRLGELVIRSANAPALVTLYRDVIGLEPFASLGTATFLKIDDDFEGHPQLLAIFEQDWEFSGPKTIQRDKVDSRVGTLRHFAFAMEKEDFDRERKRLQELSVDVQLAEHKQFGWRSIYLHDPDGNSVEFVSFDSELLDAEENR